MKYVIVLADGCADRPLEVLGGKTPLEAANIPNMDSFADKGAVSDYAVESIRWAVSRGILSGMSGANGAMNLAPQSSATRAQVVVMLHRWIANP